MCGVRGIPSEREGDECEWAVKSRTDLRVRYEGGRVEDVFIDTPSSYVDVGERGTSASAVVLALCGGGL